MTVTTDKRFFSVTAVNARSPEPTCLSGNPLVTLQEGGGMFRASRISNDIPHLFHIPSRRGPWDRCSLCGGLFCPRGALFSVPGHCVLRWWMDVLPRDAWSGCEVALVSVPLTFRFMPCPVLCVSVSQASHSASNPS